MTEDLVFPESAPLIDLINSNGWDLYRIQDSHSPFSWEELEKTGPTTEFVYGVHYVFIPRPQNGQSLREVYAQTMGLGPLLTVEDSNDDRWISLDVPKKSNGMLTALFTGFTVSLADHISPVDYAVAFNPSHYGNLSKDFVMVKADRLVETFQKNFRIVRLSEFELEVLLRMGQYPEKN